MKNRVMVILSVMVFGFGFAGSAAQAADGGANFTSGNKNNDGKYTPRNVVRPSKDPNRAPGFWDKEWKRSGLGQSGAAKWNPFSDAKKFLKEKDEKYRAKNSVESVPAAQ